MIPINYTIASKNIKYGQKWAKQINLRLDRNSQSPPPDEIIFFPELASSLHLTHPQAASATSTRPAVTGHGIIPGPIGLPRGAGWRAGMATLGTMDTILADKNPVKPADLQSQTITDKNRWNIPTLVSYISTNL